MPLDLQLVHTYFLGSVSGGFGDTNFLFKMYLLQNLIDILNETINVPLSWSAQCKMHLFFMLKD